MEKVGAKLRDARVGRGMSLDDIAQITKIPRATLTAIEAGQHAGLPATVFVRGFIRSYARAVGLDPAPLVRELERAQLEVAIDGREGVTSRTVSIQPSRVVGAHVGVGLQRPHLLLMLIAAGLILAAWLMAGTQDTHSGASTASPSAPALHERVDGVSSIGDTEEPPRAIR